jgi:putative membrane protein
MDLTAPLSAFVAGFPDFILQLAVALGLFVASLIIYVIMTPHKELALIRAGNPSAALAFAGVVVGLAIPLGSCLAYAFGLWDLVIWGVVTLRRHLPTWPAAAHRGRRRRCRRLLDERQDRPRTHHLGRHR